MKNYEAFYLEIKMGPNEDMAFLKQVGYFLLENKQIHMIFGQCTKEEDYVIIFSTAYDFMQLMKLFEDVTWEYKVSCISEKLLKGEYNDERFNKILKRPVNKRLINEFRRLNLSKDMILEIIYNKGMECLTPLEIAILKTI